MEGEKDREMGRRKERLRGKRDDGRWGKREAIGWRKRKGAEEMENKGKEGGSRKEGEGEEEQPNSKGQTAFTDAQGVLFILTLQVGINPYIAVIKTFCKSKPLGRSVCFN